VDDGVKARMISATPVFDADGKLVRFDTDNLRTVETDIEQAYPSLSIPVWTGKGRMTKWGWQWDFAKIELSLQPDRLPDGTLIYS